MIPLKRIVRSDNWFSWKIPPLLAVAYAAFLVDGTDFISALQSLAQCTKLEVVNYNLAGCKKLANVDALQGLGGLAALQTLTLGLDDCFANVDALQGLSYSLLEEEEEEEEEEF